MEQILASKIIIEHCFHIKLFWNKLIIHSIKRKVYSIVNWKKVQKRENTISLGWLSTKIHCHGAMPRMIYLSQEEDTVRPKVGDLIEIDHSMLTSGPSLKWCRVLREENETKVYIKLGLILVFHMVQQFTYEAYRQLEILNLHGQQKFQLCINSVLIYFWYAEMRNKYFIFFIYSYILII